MEPRLSLITLGVADVARSRRFYEALGWRTSSASQPDEVAFFQLGGIALALWGRAELAQDAEVPDSSGFGGMALAHNARTRAEVDAILEEVRTAGARILRPAHETSMRACARVLPIAKSKRGVGRRTSYASILPSHAADRGDVPGSVRSERCRLP